MQAERPLELYSADSAYFREHYEELLARYPDRWVAVYDRQVVAVAEDQNELISQLEREGIPPAEVYRERLSTDEDLLILSSRDR